MRKEVETKVELFKGKEGMQAVMNDISLSLRRFLLS